jgi:hypothetical protein
MFNDNNKNNKICNFFKKPVIKAAVIGCVVAGIGVGVTQADYYLQQNKYDYVSNTHNNYDKPLLGTVSGKTISFDGVNSTHINASIVNDVFANKNNPELPLLAKNEHYIRVNIYNNIPQNHKRHHLDVNNYALLTSTGTYIAPVSAAENFLQSGGGYVCYKNNNGSPTCQNQQFLYFKVSDRDSISQLIYKTDNSIKTTPFIYNYSKEIHNDRLAYVDNLRDGHDKLSVLWGLMGLISGILSFIVLKNKNKIQLIPIPLNGKKKKNYEQYL